MASQIIRAVDDNSNNLVFDNSVHFLNSLFMTFSTLIKGKDFTTFRMGCKCVINYSEHIILHSCLFYKPHLQSSLKLF